MAPSPQRGWLKWTLIAAVAAMLAMVSVPLVLLRPAYLEAVLEEQLEERLRVDVSIGTVAVDLLPRPTLTVNDLVLNLRERNRPAFIRVARVTTEIGPFSMWRGHVNRVEARGLEIVVPPGRESDTRIGPTTRKLNTDIIIDRLEAFDARLTLERAEREKEPLVFAIHRLVVRDVGVDRAMPFAASLTNPVPEGLVETEGIVGAWKPDDPTTIELSGRYAFKLVNLGSIRGLGGALESSGTFEGHLTRIAVEGTATTPDFSLDLGGRRLPLTASFRATVNGSDGSTDLHQVDAELRDTPMRVRGTIDNLPGPGRRHIALAAEVDSGRIEDLLELVVDAKPALSGGVSLKTTVDLPPGPGSVRDRMVLDGTFGLPGTEFADPRVRVKLAEFSRRSLASDSEGVAQPVQGRLAGRFRMAGGVLSFRDLRFAVPGAEVRVQGNYSLESERLDLAGDVRMEATVSQAAGGWKGAMLKPFDWWFRRDGAGAVIPITIAGNPARPEVGVSVRRLIRRGD